MPSDLQRQRTFQHYSFRIDPAQLARIKAGFPTLLAQTAKEARVKDQRLEKPVDGYPGLSVVTNTTGNSSYAFRYRRPGSGIGAKLTLGRVDNKARSSAEPQIGDAMNVADAIRLVERCRDLLQQGVDPAGMKAPKDTPARQAVDASDNGPTVDTLFAKYMDWYAGEQVRGSTLERMAGLLGLKRTGDGWSPSGNGVLAHWTGKPLARRDGTPLITKRDAIELLDQKKRQTPVSAKRTKTALSQFGDWAEDRGFLSVNPFARLRFKYKETPRERVLSDSEIRRLWKQQDTIYGKGACLILATGQRPSEVFEADWSEFDLDAAEWIIPAERSKNGRKHLVPLSALALTLLRQLPTTDGYLFPTNRPRPIIKHSNNKRALVKAAGLPGWSYHDNRRTAFNWIDEHEDLGTSYAHAVTNHTPDKLAQTYSPAELRKRLKWKQKALDMWGEHLAAIVA